MNQQGKRILVTGYSTSKLPDLNALLKQVSRSFYLSIRVLPRKIRPQIGLTYVLARATDTVADTRSAPAELRKGILLEMRREIGAAAAGEATHGPDFRGLSENMASDDRSLLESFPEALDVLRSCSSSDRRCMGDVLLVITEGQELDLSRFEDTGSGRVASLDTDEQLDDYTYRVAGCVGEFWTKMCRAHLFPKAKVPDAFLLEKGVRFGKGLQLVNILRDLPRDLRQGRCYIPLASLAGLGLSPESLLDPASMKTFRPLYDRYIRQADSYLADGRAYVDSLPRSQLRVRMACTLPMLIGVETLARLRTRNILDDSCRVKVSRPEVRRLIFISLLHCLRPARDMQ
jgi:farnesyl-diphosphate farnesyltransferase